MKKLISLILSFIIVLSFNVTVFAVPEGATADIILESSSDGIISFILSVKNCLYLSSGDLKVEYDSSVLEFSPWKKLESAQVETLSVPKAFSNAGNTFSGLGNAKHPDYKDTVVFGFNFLEKLDPEAYEIEADVSNVQLFRFKFKVLNNKNPIKLNLYGQLNFSNSIVKIDKQYTFEFCNHNIVTDNAVAATCQATGLTEGTHCSLCNIIIKKQEVIEKLPHTWGEYEVTTPATAQATGIKTRTCSMCNSQETAIIPKVEKIEIEQTGEIKLLADQPQVFATTGVTAHELKNQLNADVTVINKKGENVSDTQKLGTGMKIVLKQGNTVIDEITVVVPGDVDGDAKISSSDARDTLRASVNLQKLDDNQAAAADMDSPSPKNKIDSSDARYILRASVSLEDVKEWIAKAQ